MPLLNISPKETTIGFVGTGVMGRSMAGHLQAAGYRIAVYTRTPAKAQSLLDAGAVWKESIADLARDTQVIITMVGYPVDVEEIYLGEGGMLAAAAPGTVFVDMTSSRPDLAQRIESEAKAQGLHALDAPVSGGDIGARDATLSIMVGGEEAIFNQLRPLLEMMGKNVVYQGGAGSGQHTKICNQIAGAASVIGVCESMAYAKKSGLDPETVLQSISSGAAGSWSLTNLAPRVLQDDFAAGFYMKHFVKDLKIAVESAEAIGLNIPGTKLAKELYEKLEADGYGDLGTQALFKYYH
ncbi:MAG: NAD(P)-dependent oxidoreductase [Verrucomicrobiota bacterium]